MSEKLLCIASILNPRLKDTNCLNKVLADQLKLHANIGVRLRGMLRGHKGNYFNI